MGNELVQLFSTQGPGSFLSKLVELHPALVVRTDPKFPGIVLLNRKGSEDLGAAGPSVIADGNALALHLSGRERVFRLRFADADIKTATGEPMTPPEPGAEEENIYSFMQALQVAAQTLSQGDQAPADFAADCAAAITVAMTEASPPELPAEEKTPVLDLTPGQG